MQTNTQFCSQEAIVINRRNRVSCRTTDKTTFLHSAEIAEWNKANYIWSITQESSFNARDQLRDPRQWHEDSSSSPHHQLGQRRHQERPTSIATKRQTENDALFKSMNRNCSKCFECPSDYCVHNKWQGCLILLIPTTFTFSHTCVTFNTLISTIHSQSFRENSAIACCLALWQKNIKVPICLALRSTLPMKEMSLA